MGLFLLRPRLPYNAICELDYRNFFCVECYKALCLHFLDLNRKDAKNAEEKLKEALCSLRLCGKFLSETKNCKDSDLTNLLVS